ncbi:hypothetical protein HV819_04385 [Anaerococcus sp. AGMB00486]|uniref:DUF4179 domain-containing protein n=2 Tax=Anaerococcus TaxID=165779 RepID=A0ABX2N961_9FIRM|nr:MULTISPECIES: hypothetical protein [Anaerococcus]MSS77559.1 hypothetical protein [Anaerococcus porci]NVF11231.1 hypothetical protein [Anaerococcus faecalis]
MNNIYDKINDIKFDESKMDLDQIEYENMLKIASKYKKNSSRKKFVALAAALILVASLSIKPVRTEASKFATDIKVTMMETIGASPDSYKYVTELHKPIKLGGNELILENFVIEDNRVFANILSSSNGKAIEEIDNDIYIYKIKVNGESFKSWGSSGSARMADDGESIVNQSMITFDKDFPKLDNADIDIYISSGTSSEVVSIKASSNIVNEDNKIFAEDYKLENGASINLMKINPITMTAVVDNLDPAYSYELIGTDENGHKVQLDQRTSEDGKVTFLYNSSFSDLKLDELKDGRPINFTLTSSKRNVESGKETDGVYDKIAEFSLSAK